MSPMYMAALRQAVELGQIMLFDDMDLRVLAASPLVVLMRQALLLPIVVAAQRSRLDLRQ